MSDREEAVELLDVAARELRALEGMRDEEVFADEVFGFMAQQTAEKCLKAWLCILGQTYPFTHDLASLLLRLEELDQDVRELWDLTDWNVYAVQRRYASASDDVPLDRDDVIVRAERLYQHVSALVEATTE